MINALQVSEFLLITLNVIHREFKQWCLVCIDLCDDPVCDHPSTCAENGPNHGECLCTESGVHCVGNCSGDFNTLNNGIQSCDGE